MSSTVKTRSVFSLLVILPLLVLADKSPIKLGNISEEELRMTYYPSDSTADAVILCDYGTTKIQINRSEGGFQVVYDKICRIKIFNNNGYDWATGSIRLYNDATVKEDISSLKGYTYNMDNGKIQKEKLSKQSIFEEKTSDEWTTIKFTMPEVKEGSVIEYQYQIVSDRLTSLRTWEL
jgi:hypothetical protein